MQLVTRSILQVGGTHNALGLPHPGWKADTLSLCFLGAQASPPTSSDSRYRSPCCPLCLTSRGIFPYPGLGMLVVAFVSGNLSTCPLPRKDLAPASPAGWVLALEHALLRVQGTQGQDDCMCGDGQQHCHGQCCRRGQDCGCHRSAHPGTCSKAWP